MTLALYARYHKEFTHLLYMNTIIEGWKHQVKCVPVRLIYAWFVRKSGHYPLSARGVDTMTLNSDPELNSIYVT